MNTKRLAVTLVLVLCLVTAGTGAASAADAGTEKCIPPEPYGAVTDSGVSVQGCTQPGCCYTAPYVVEP